MLVVDTYYVCKYSVTKYKLYLIKNKGFCYHKKTMK